MEISTNLCYKFIMKKFILGILIFILWSGFYDATFSAEEIQLGNIKKNKIELEKQPKTLKGSLLISDNEMLAELIELQKTKDLGH